MDILKILVLATGIMLLRCSTVRMHPAGAWVGSNHGAFVHMPEQTDGVSGATLSADAVTGATTTRFGTGAAADIRIGTHTVGTGLEYAAYDQELRYDPAYTAYDGTRSFRYHQVRVPLTYDVRLGENGNGQPLVILRPGVSAGYTAAYSITSRGALPDYSFTRWDAGVQAGVEWYPVRSAYGAFGVYGTMYRSGSIYDDGELVSGTGGGNLSSGRFGVVWRR